MKLNKLFIGAIAALASAAMVACSDDAPDVNNGGENPDGGGYLAVNIVTPTAGSRAEADDFQDGTEDENYAESAMFLFFDAAGNPTQTPQIEQVSWTNQSNGNNVAYEKLSDAIVTVAGKTNPTQMLVVLNPGTIRLAGLSLKAVLEKVENYGTATKGAFIMTNSVYFENNKIVVTTPLSGDNIKETPEAAKSAAVNVYVERVVAKITTANDGLSTNIGNTDITTADDEVIKIEPTIEGLEIANAATNSFLFKNIDNISTWVTQWSEVTDPANKRSYWASNYAKREFTNYSWNNIGQTIETDNTFYVQENTNITQQTAVIISASLKYTNGDGDKVDAKLVKWAGNYYLKDKFVGRFATLVNNAGYEIITTDNDGNTITHRPFGSDDLRYLTIAEHKAAVESGDIRAYQSAGHLNVTLGENQQFAKNVVDGTTTTYETATAEEINKFLLGEANLVWLWEGKSYYYVPIKHFGPKSLDGANPAFDFTTGVIRNHIYQLKLKGLTGLGTPVVDPDETIIPEKPDEKLFYVAAQMYILRWRLVSQDVNFTD